MSSVVRTDADCIQLQGLVIQHFDMRPVAFYFHAEFLKEGLRLSLHQICSCHDLHIGLMPVALQMSLGNPPGTDDSHPHFPGSINHRLLSIFFKAIQNIIRHNDSFPSSQTVISDLSQLPR